MNIQHRRAPRSQQCRFYRIQDREGPGPFRPGFSKMWIDTSGPVKALPTWTEEFGTAAAEEAVSAGLTVFSAVRTVDKIRDWFTDAERQRLYGFGFYLVEVPHAIILAESEHQVLCCRELPLTFGVMNRRPI